MIFFFTFDIGLVLCFIVLFIAMLFGAGQDVVQRIISNYAGTMQKVLIVSVVLAIIAGIITAVVADSIGENDKKLSPLKKHSGNILSSISSTIFSALTFPPVVLFIFDEVFFDFMQEIARSDGFLGFLWLMFAGVLMLVVYIVIAVLVSVIGFGIPLLINMLCIAITAENKFLGSIANIIFGGVISAVYYFILQKQGIYPFSMVLA